MGIHKYEKLFLSISGFVLVAFLLALLYSTVSLGIELPTRGDTINPSEVRTTPPFDEPGVREVAPGEYEVVIVGQAWTFDPEEIRVPAGAEITFISTSADVVHGLMIEGTRVNVMMIPGQIAEVTYRFDQPGEHLMICHEYCGLGHHVMSGKVIVE